MTEFERFTHFCKRLFKLREIKKVETFDTAPFRVRVTLDYNIINSFVQKQLEQAGRLLGNTFPGACYNVIPFEENYITPFPYLSVKQAVQGGGGPNVVETAVGGGYAGYGDKVTVKRNKLKKPTRIG